MKREQFLNLPTAEIARIVHATTDSQVCVFPFNGTRRWFLLEHGKNLDKNVDPSEAYSDISGKQYLAMYDLIFSHGLDTLLVPTFGGELLNRGAEYMEKIGIGLARLATHPDFVSFYHQHHIRVRFYGNYRAILSDTPYAYIIDLFDQITAQTQKNDRYRLFYGVFADDYIEPIARLTVEHFKRTGKHPTKRELIEAYYGEYVEKANIFIGFEKFSAYDYPLLAWGEESLYFTAAPSFYMTENQIRNILYDYLYLRPAQDPDYFNMPANDFEAMRHFYEMNREVTFGVGETRGGIWYPTSNTKE